MAKERIDLFCDLRKFSDPKDELICRIERSKELSRMFLALRTIESSESGFFTSSNVANKIGIKRGIAWELLDDLARLGVLKKARAREQNKIKFVPTPLLMDDDVLRIAKRSFGVGE